MRLTALLVTALALAAVFVAPGAARQDDDGMRNLIDLDAAERQRLQVQALDLAQPVAEHERLAAYAGTFDADVSMWTLPGQPASKATGEMKHEAVLGGRFLRISGKVTYEFPGMGKYVVESIQYLGFDRRSGKYTSVGFDSMGTYATLAEGSLDPMTNVLTMSGVTEDQALKIRQAYDTTVEFVDADTMKVSTIVYDAFQAGPFKLMEVVSKRRAE